MFDMNATQIEVGNYVSYDGYDLQDYILQVHRIKDDRIFCGIGEDWDLFWIDAIKCRVLTKEEVFLYKLGN